MPSSGCLAFFKNKDVSVDRHMFPCLASLLCVQYVLRRLHAGKKIWLTGHPPWSFLILFCQVRVIYLCFEHICSCLLENSGLVQSWHVHVGQIPSQTHIL